MAGSGTLNILKYIYIYWHMCVVCAWYLWIYFTYQYNSIHISEEMIYNSYTVYTGQNTVFDIAWHFEKRPMPQNITKLCNRSRGHGVCCSWHTQRWDETCWCSRIDGLLLSECPILAQAPGNASIAGLKNLVTRFFPTVSTCGTLVIDFVQAFGSCTCTDSFYIPPTKSLSNAHQQPRSSLVWFSHGPLEVRWILIPRGPNQDQSRSDKISIRSAKQESPWPHVWPTWPPNKLPTV